MWRSNANWAPASASRTHSSVVHRVVVLDVEQAEPLNGVEPEERLGLHDEPAVEPLALEAEKVRGRHRLGGRGAKTMRLPSAMNLQRPTEDVKAVGSVGVGEATDHLRQRLLARTSRRC